MEAAHEGMDVSLIELLLQGGTEGDSTKFVKEKKTPPLDLCHLFDPSTDKPAQLAPVPFPVEPENAGSTDKDNALASVTSAPRPQMLIPSSTKFALATLAFALLFKMTIVFMSSNLLNRSFDLSADELCRINDLDHQQSPLLSIKEHPGLAFSFLSDSYTSSENQASWSPLVITPDTSTNKIALSDLAEWAVTEAPHLLTKFGALLFRGFDELVGSPESFEMLASSVAPDLQDTYLGTSPRLPVAGTSKIFTSVELDPWIPIPDHAEMSFVESPPRALFFYAASIENVGNDGRILPGGETALVNYQTLWKSIDPAVRKRFVDKGIMYTRRYLHQDAFPVLDPRFTKR